MDSSALQPVIASVEKTLVELEVLKRTPAVRQPLAGRYLHCRLANGVEFTQRIHCSLCNRLAKNWCNVLQNRKTQKPELSDRINIYCQVIGRVLAIFGEMTVWPVLGEAFE